MHLFPLRDDNPTEITPYVTMALIAATAGSWVYFQGAGANAATLQASVCSLGAIPAEITGATEAGQGVGCRLGGLGVGALFTSMFLHGSWLHLIGNLWFLWIFGNNVEDSMGHLRFLVFYLLTGVIAALGHVVTDPTSVVPMVGASGAISAIMGAYMLLYPRARVATFIFLFIFVRVVELPAVLFLGLWFAYQVLAGTAPSAGSGGVAFWAHISGFVAGAVLIFLFRNPTLVGAKRAGVRLDGRDIPHRGWL